MKIRTFASAATALGLTVALGLTEAASAQAVTTSVRPAACNRIEVGDSMPYTVPGFDVVGTVSQQYDSCSGNTIAHWDWNLMASTVPGFYNLKVTLGLGSMGFYGGVPDWDWTNTKTFSQTPGGGFDYALRHGAASPDSWRAGAIIDNSGCAAWTSQHWYANGSETAGPYAGCGDTQNLTQIPWTRPY
ncbi:hypothetical protein GCM10010441_39980 [Kitasatospora paracochleata]|uniref:Secreted protein n=1 Tax=Kitasatospora paracochleata TaxID=58354 RepID=A0ABT1IVX3_9ACTN|nr:hypothetical protein [Kitasatospora paracochleata]MCP2309282.1 hypothetical protein [Kitasatospora paracochleata]